MAQCCHAEFALYFGTSFAYDCMQEAPTRVIHVAMSFESSGMVQRRHGSDHPHPVDVHVGARVRLRRTLLGMSQEKLGDALGLTFQQVQKYERGTNRIGASRLYHLSRVLDVPVEFFFEEIDHGQLQADYHPGLSEPAAPPFEGEKGAGRETLELMRVYQRITDVALRRRLFDLAKALAGAYFRA
jgi:transcriptional regulator with XRE-family HTH domain